MQTSATLGLTAVEKTTFHVKNFTLGLFQISFQSVIVLATLPPSESRTSPSLRIFGLK